MYAIIDIETTGGSYKFGKITEISIFIHDGFQVVDEFTTLINPEMNIPMHITNLTGITNEMVKTAPKFYEVAKKIVEITEDKVFVAHNSSFDYGFIKEEFRRLGFIYSKNTLCTVKFSRKIFPNFSSYSLGELCKHMDIVIDGRHRARGDAYATVQLLEILFSRDRKNIGKHLIIRNNLDAQINEHLEKKIIDALPETTGIYFLHGVNGEVHYVGKSVNIHKRVTQHFLNETSLKAQQIIDQTADITYEETGSELVALLKESVEIKKLQPKFNAKQIRNSYKYGIFTSLEIDGIIRIYPKVIKKGEVPFAYFSTEQEAKERLNQLVMKYGLCPAMCGLEKTMTGKACFNFKIHVCKGVCCDQEDISIYNQRVEKALSKINFEEDNFLIVEPGRSEEEKAVVKIENGHFTGLGYINVTYLNDDIDLLKECVNRYDKNKEVNSIVSSYLKKNDIKSVILY